MNRSDFLIKRTPKEELLSISEGFYDTPLMRKFIETVPIPYLVLTKTRQIVYVNQIALESNGYKDVFSHIGERPGELFGCENSKINKYGCGTSEQCKKCGALSALLGCIRLKEPTTGSCRIVNENQDEFFFNISLSPLEIRGGKYYAMTFNDLTQEFRRKSLERLFFHDILNTATAAYGILALLMKNSTRGNNEEYIGIAFNSLQILIEEIRHQRILSLVKDHRYSIDVSTVSTLKTLTDVMSFHKHYTLQESKHIELDENCVNISIITDETLLRRIVYNMLKNAVEASKKNETVTVGCNSKENQIEFWVHNNSFISDDIYEKIFTQQISTKGTNRGLGTHSMKLLASLIEGKVSFTSSREKGTTFFILLPKNIGIKEEDLNGI